MDHNIKYVREKKIAPLLNDLVMHLVSTKPVNVIDALLIFLEKRNGQSSPATVAPQQYATAKITADDDDASIQQKRVTKPPKGSSQQHAPQKPTEAPTEFVPRRPVLNKVQVPATTNDVTDLVSQLQRNEYEFLQLLNVARESAVSKEDVVDVTTATVHSNEISDFARQILGNDQSVNHFTDMRRRQVSEKAYFSASIFGLLHELEKNQLESRSMCNAVSAIDPNAASSFNELLRVIQQCEEMQVGIDIMSNKGKPSQSVLKMFSGLQNDISNVAAELKDNMTNLQQCMPKGSAVASSDVQFEDLPLDKQADSLLSQFLVNEKKALEVLGSISGDAATTAASQSTEQVRVVKEMLRGNVALSTKVPDSLEEVTKELLATSANIHSNIELLKRNTAHIGAEVGSAAAKSILDQLQQNESEMASALSALRDEGKGVIAQSVAEAISRNYQMSQLLKEFSENQGALVQQVTRK